MFLMILFTTIKNNKKGYSARKRKTLGLLVKSMFVSYGFTYFHIFPLPFFQLFLGSGNQKPYLPLPANLTSANILSIVSLVKLSRSSSKC